jgi:hypothetical protein
MRWLVDVMTIGKTETESLYVEGESWQKALQAARAHRGEFASMSGFSIELSDEGCRAVDSATRLRYIVRRAPDDALGKASDLTPASGRDRTSVLPNMPAPEQGSPAPRATAQQPRPSSMRPPLSPGAAALVLGPPVPGTPRPPSDPPASSTPAEAEPSPARTTASGALPATPARAELGSSVPSQVVFKREQEATESVPLTYREYVFLVPLGTTEKAAETLLRTQLELVRASLARAPLGKLVNLAVFDIAFHGKPTVPPLSTLTWKDWRDDPTVEFPRRPGFARAQNASRAGTASRQVAGSPGPDRPVPFGGGASAAPSVHARNALPIVVPAAMVSVPAVGLALAPQERASSAAIAPATGGEKAAIEPARTVPRSGTEPDAMTEPSRPSADAIPLATARPSGEAIPLALSRPSAEAIPLALSRPPADAIALALSRPPADAIALVPAEPAATPDAVEPAAPARIVALEPAFRIDVPKGASPVFPPNAETLVPPAPEPLIAEPEAPVLAPHRARVPGEELIADLFESMHELHFMRDALEGGEFCIGLAIDRIPSHAAIVHLYDIDRREFLVTSTRGARADALLLRRHAEGDAVLSVAMKKGRAVVFADATQGEPAALERYVTLGGAQSVIVAPVALSGRFLGAIEMVNPLDGQPYTEAEGNAITYIAEQFAQFLESHGIVTDPQRIRSRAG